MSLYASDLCSLEFRLVARNIHETSHPMPIISSRFVSCAQKGGWRTPVHLYGIIEEMNDSKQAAWGFLYVCARTFDVWTVLVRSQKYHVGKSTVFFCMHIGMLVQIIMLP